MALTESQLSQIASAREVVIETRQRDRARRTVIWVVVDDGEIFARSFRGAAGRWYQEALANPQVTLIVAGDRHPLIASPATDASSVSRTSEGFRQKYGKGRSVGAMVRPEVLDTTLRLTPA